VSQNPTTPPHVNVYAGCHDLSDFVHVNQLLEYEVMISPYEPFGSYVGVVAGEEFGDQGLLLYDKIAGIAGLTCFQPRDKSDNCNAKKKTHFDEKACW
jgi:hypothetical protein